MNRLRLSFLLILGLLMISIRTASAQSSMPAVNPMDHQLYLQTTTTPGTYIVYYGIPKSGYVSFAQIGVFTSASLTEVGWTDMSSIQSSLPNGNPFLLANTNGADLQYSAGGVIGGTLDVDSASGISDITFTGTYVTHGYSWGLNESGEIMIVQASGTGMSGPMMDLYEYAFGLECDAGPPSNYPVAEIITTVLGCLAIVGGATNTFACINDALSAADAGRVACRVAYGLSAPTYCPAQLDACFDCVKDKFDEDNLNCCLTAGTNQEDADYGLCVTEASLVACQ